MIDGNLHTHSFYCGHGHGQIEEYVEKAKAIGLGILGFSEHLPLPDNKFSKSRMSFNEMPLYEEDVKRYENDDGIKILLGYEADYYPHYHKYTSDVKSRVDYLTFGVHFVYREEEKRYVSPFTTDLNLKDLNQYFMQYNAALESGLFLFAAHPDLVYMGYTSFDSNLKALFRDIIKVSKEFNIPLEINGNGLLKRQRLGKETYPVSEFWDMAFGEDMVVISGYDAHEVEDLENSKNLLSSFCRERGYDKLLSEIAYENGELSIRKRDLQK